MFNAFQLASISTNMVDFELKRYINASFVHNVVTRRIWIIYPKLKNLTSSLIVIHFGQHFVASSKDASRKKLLLSQVSHSILSGAFSHPLPEREEEERLCTLYDLEHRYLNLVKTWSAGCGLATNPENTKLISFTSKYGVPIAQLPSIGDRWSVAFIFCYQTRQHICDWSPTGNYSAS